MQIFIGDDQAEAAACRVATKTAEQFDHHVTLIREERLRMAGMLTRPVEKRGQQWYDFNSQAPQATQFAISRFFVPLMQHRGWALFVDCDVVFMTDPYELLSLADARYAVQVVKHQHNSGPERKMVNQQQQYYVRKNWSSVVLWNCSHLAHRRLNLTTLNQWPGRYLHAFGWLSDDEIGHLPGRFNWLVGVQPKPTDLAIAHFTEGGPFIPGWQPRPHDDLWLAAAARPVV